MPVVRTTVQSLLTRPTRQTGNNYRSSFSRTITSTLLLWRVSFFHTWSGVHAWVATSPHSRNSSTGSGSKSIERTSQTTGTSSSSSSSSASVQFWKSRGMSLTSPTSLRDPAWTTATTIHAAGESTSNDGNDGVGSCGEATLWDDLKARTLNSWVAQLSAETPEHFAKSLASVRRTTDDVGVNRTQRPVYNGHYIPVVPLGLEQPRLVLYNTELGSALFGTAAPGDHDFWTTVTNMVAGNVVVQDAWATPYALSIMGTRYTSNCPYGTGDGYGDGRAIAIGELQVIDSNETPSGHVNDTTRWELQLKGAGPTPFCRGADGRAVLRSSIREFLASEAMHALGIGTTRALSLVVSATAHIRRPWYSRTNDETASSPLQRTSRPSSIPTMDDARLASYPVEQRRKIILQLRRQFKSDPDTMGLEAAAIACRAASSFCRIGHLDLFARRATKTTNAKRPYDTTSLAWRELEALVWHVCYRELRDSAYTPYIATQDIASAATRLLDESAIRIATMVAHWIRVGFAQGNFNADNCLVGGKTMDYGPFGFMEEYDPLFAKWTGSGEHFGFMNQPNAGYANYGVLVESVVPVIAAARGLDASERDELQTHFLDEAAQLFHSKLDEVLRLKLGFDETQDAGDEIWEQLESLLRSSRVDWTLFFRELSYVVRDTPELFVKDVPLEASVPEQVLVRLLGDDATRDGSSPLYEALAEDQRASWTAWIASWMTALATSTDDGDLTAVAQRMLATNPKYVLREWMLVEAYQKAARSDEAELHALYALIQRPYDEGTPAQTNRYYRRAPDEVLLAGGTAFMS